MSKPRVKGIEEAKSRVKSKLGLKGKKVRLK
jgi:hypothetical protein